MDARDRAYPSTRREARPQAWVIRQVSGKGLGILAPVLESLGFSLRYLDAPSDDLAALSALEPELLIMLGGPPSALDDQRFGFLREQLHLIEQRLQASRPMLGICLGAQLMTRAMGGRIHRDGARELGWWPVNLTAQGQSSSLRFLDRVSVLHWHRDAMELPEGVRCLAGTEACPVQAFSAPGGVLGLQFHPEVGSKDMAQWLAMHVNELNQHPHQSVESLWQDSQRCIEWMNQRAEAMLRDWVSSLDESALVQPEAGEVSSGRGLWPK